MICKKCGCTEHYRKDVPPHIGAYCANCGAWITWVPKALQKQYEDAVAQQVRNEICTIKPIGDDKPPWEE